MVGVIILYNLKYSSVSLKLLVVSSIHKSRSNFKMTFCLVESFRCFCRSTLTAPLRINGLDESPKTKRVKQRTLVFGAASLALPNRHERIYCRPVLSYNWVIWKVMAISNICFICNIFHIFRQNGVVIF